MLSTQMEKAENIQEQMDNESWKIKTPRAKQKEMLEIKNTVTEWTKNAFQGLITRQDIAMERSREREDKPKEISQTERKSEKEKQNAHEWGDNHKMQKYT